MAPLSKSQKAMLAKHAAHHTPKHMRSMRAHMAAGKSFAAAHKIAMAKVGK